MSSIALYRFGDRRWGLVGDLDFSTVPDAWRMLSPLLVEGGELTLSMGRVQRANSAALALLLQAREVMADAGGELLLEAVPEELSALARMSNLPDFGPSRSV